VRHDYFILPALKRYQSQGLRMTHKAGGEIGLALIKRQAVYEQNMLNLMSPIFSHRVLSLVKLIIKCSANRR
jgi:hypothetical protein